MLLAVDAVAAACKRQSVRIRRNAGRTAGDYSIALRTAMWLLFMCVQQQMKMTMFWQPIHPRCDPGREALRVAVPRLWEGTPREGMPSRSNGHPCYVLHPGRWLFMASAQRLHGDFGFTENCVTPAHVL